MSWNIIKEICDWNEERGNTTYSAVLEGSMIEEELAELGVAYVDEDIVAQADAIADIIFVAIGSLYKLTGCDEQKVRDIMLAVTAANNMKGSKRDDWGKIIKNPNFVGPENMIKEILDED